jgi:MFS transporter, SP family, general alpha glucoside:H+ symporter
MTGYVQVPSVSRDKSDCTNQFQQQVPGNVIPMQAFINTMADTMIDGKPAISATVVSYWQGFAEMSKMTGMFIGGIFANRFGRK